MLNPPLRDRAPALKKQRQAFLSYIGILPDALYKFT